MRIVGLITLALILYGCDDMEDLNTDRIISYGTSFGECIGYCKVETHLSDNSLLIIAKGWSPDVAAKTNSVEISDEQVNQIRAGINLEKFAKLPETIGCPDCADGGAEWLELIIDGEKKKVTFEYMEDIDGIAEGVILLRNLTEEYYPD